MLSYFSFKKCLSFCQSDCACNFCFVRVYNSCLHPFSSADFFSRNGSRGKISSFLKKTCPREKDIPKKERGGVGMGRGWLDSIGCAKHPTAQIAVIRPPPRHNLVPEWSKTTNILFSETCFFVHRTKRVPNKTSARQLCFPRASAARYLPAPTTTGSHGATT